MPNNEIWIKFTERELNLLIELFPNKGDLEDGCFTRDLFFYDDKAINSLSVKLSNMYKMNFEKGGRK